MHNYDEVAFDGTAETIRKIISFDSTTGQIKRGNFEYPMTGINHYITIKINGVIYYAHRLAWLHFYGKWPDGHIDHINGNRRDNRIANLRDVTVTVNMINKPLQSNNKSGARGVRKHADGKFQAQITVSKKNKHLGSFETLDEAAHAYNKAAIQHFGEFAVLNPVGA